MISEEKIQELINHLIGTSGEGIDVPAESENYFWDEVYKHGVDECSECGIYWYNDDLYDGMCESCEEIANAD